MWSEQEWYLNFKKIPTGLLIRFLLESEQDYHYSLDHIFTESSTRLQLELWLDSHWSLFRIAPKIWVELLTISRQSLLLESAQDFHWNMDKIATVHMLHKVAIRLLKRIPLHSRQDSNIKLDKITTGIWTSWTSKRFFWNLDKLSIIICSRLPL